MHHAHTFGSITSSSSPWFRPQNKLDGGYTEVMSQNLPDGELIKRYLQENDERAFRMLVERHYTTTQRRFLKHCHHVDDAADLTQQLWIRVINNLDHYRDDGKFPAFLNRISTNLLTDYWRSKGRKGIVIDGLAPDDENDPIEQAPAPQPDADTSLDTQQQVDYLAKELIPALPIDQRLIFLLRHESEYWEEKQRLEWVHLAELNGIDEQTTWSLFEQARNTLLSLQHKDNSTSTSNLNDESLLIFLVWTQAQRLSKRQDFSWDYFAKLLNISTNTLKTRYRAATKKLSDGLSARY